VTFPLVTIPLPVDIIIPSTLKQISAYQLALRLKRERERDREKERQIQKCVGARPTMKRNEY